MSISYNLKWEVVNDCSDIRTIQDPLSGSQIPKSIFYETYKNLLDMLDGQTASDYFDFFFHKQPITEGAYEFISEMEKSDFLDWCQELDILPTMSEIKQGETVEEKNKRIAKELNIQKQKQLLAEKKKNNKKNAGEKMKIQLQISLENINKKIQTENNSEKLKILYNKKEKIMNRIKSFQLTSN